LAGSASANSSRKCLRDATCDSSCYLKSREIHRRHKLSVVANKRVFLPFARLEELLEEHELINTQSS
jgi:hypothetical protein